MQLLVNLSLGVAWQGRTKSLIHAALFVDTREVLCLNPALARSLAHSERVPSSIWKIQIIRGQNISLWKCSPPHASVQLACSPPHASVQLACSPPHASVQLAWTSQEASQDIHQHRLLGGMKDEWHLIKHLLTIDWLNFFGPSCGEIYPCRN